MVVQLVIILMSIVLYTVDRYRYTGKEKLGTILEREYLKERQQS